MNVQLTYPSVTDESSTESNRQNGSFETVLTTSWRDLGDEGNIDEGVLDSYGAQLDKIEANGQRVCIALNGHEIPDDLAKVGWRSRETADRYTSYAGALAARFGHRIDQWLTMSAPIATLDHHFGLAGRSLVEAASDGVLDASHHLLLAHGNAVQAVRAHVPGCEIGIVLDVDVAVPATDADRTIAGGWAYEWFPQALATGTYPDGVVEAFGWDQSVVRPGDQAIISRPIDFVSLRATANAGNVVDRLSSQYGFERFRVVRDPEVDAGV